MNKKRGISLITLIITIIVIIILAGAVILSLNNTNIIENSNKAVTEQDKASLIDTYNMFTMDKFILNSAKNENIGNITINELYTKIGKDLGNKFKVDNNDLLEIYEDGSYSVIAKFPNSVSYTRNKEYSAYNRPFIPDDFNYLEGTWDTGLVIKNKTDNNEFVWIPVDGKTIKYEKRDFKKTYVKKVDTKNREISLAPTETNSDNIYKIEKGNVEKYGGFYIGRYEAAIEDIRGSHTPAVEKLIIQPLKRIYNFVGYNDAKRLSDELYSDKVDYISTLITGTQWDTACMFLGEDYANDSTGKGKYSHGFDITGNNEDYKVKNVYDMAGNAYEITNEKKEYTIYRGGSCRETGSGFPAGCRASEFPPDTGNITSFRVAFFIK